jgi:hypothetical protein
VPATSPHGPSPLVHLKRAFGWNLGRVVPAPAEDAALQAAGVTEPVVRRYAAWRRSLLLVALVPTLVAVALAVLDALDEGFDELTLLGRALYYAWLAAAAALPIACVLGIRSWTRPRASSVLLRVAWAAAFLVPFVYALLPVEATYRMGPDDLAAGTSDKLEALHDMALDFVLSAGEYLLLLPAVLALLPGAMNGCLRIKSLIPAAQLPGWLLVCAAPAFLLLWLVVLVVVNLAVQSPLLVLGVMLWAGSAIGYSLRGRFFVQSQITEDDAARIARVKRVVGLGSLAGIGLLVAFVATSEVAGLDVVGTDGDAAMATRLDELAADDDEVDLEDVGTAYAESRSFLYAFDLSSFWLVVDLLAKLLVGTAVFADLVLRGALVAWRNERAIRAQASSYDASAAALGELVAQARVDGSNRSATGR